MKSLLHGLLVGAFTLVSAHVLADDEPPSSPSQLPADSDISRAREAFLLGLGLSHVGQWTDALAQFQRSAKLKPHPITSYNIAYCERSLGLHASAYLHFRAALNADLPLPNEYQAQARAYIAEAERRVAHVHVLLAAPDQSLHVDGKRVVLQVFLDRAFYVASEEAASARAPLPRAFDLWLDPGPHLLSVSGPHQMSTVQSILLPAGAAVEIRLRTVESGRAASPRREAPVPGRAAALGALGVGAAGLIASGVFGLLALSEKHELSQEKCPNEICPQPYHMEEERMKAFANVSSVAFALGALGVGAGSYLFLRAMPASAAAPYGLRIEPTIGLGSASITGRF